jgi:hypothetical protein
MDSLQKGKQHSNSSQERVTQREKEKTDRAKTERDREQTQRETDTENHMAQMCTA